MHVLQHMPLTLPSVWHLCLWCPLSVNEVFPIKFREMSTWVTHVRRTVQAGRPKTISGFQTHTTPVLLSVGERAELATQKYLAVNPVLEGIVILQGNPEYIESQE